MLNKIYQIKYQLSSLEQLEALGSIYQLKEWIEKSFKSEIEFKGIKLNGKVLIDKHHGLIEISY